MENSIHRRSTLERFDNFLKGFFSGSAEDRAESAALSPDNQTLGSAQGVPASAALVGQSGGGGGERPLSAPAPALTIREAEAFWTEGGDALAPECTCGGVDVPGVGVGHLAGGCPAAYRREPISLRLRPAEVVALGAEEEARGCERRERREALLIQLMFAARDLAWSLEQPSGCEMCGGGRIVPGVVGGAGFVHHAKNCRAERVLEIVGELCALEQVREREGGAR